LGSLAEGANLRNLFYNVLDVLASFGAPLVLLVLLWQFYFHFLATSTINELKLAEIREKTAATTINEITKA